MQKKLWIEGILRRDCKTLTTRFFSLGKSRRSILIAQRKKCFLERDADWKIKNKVKISFNRKQNIGIWEEIEPFSMEFTTKLKNIINITHHFYFCSLARSIEVWHRQYINRIIRFDQRDCLLQLDSLFRLFANSLRLYVSQVKWIVNWPNIYASNATTMKPQQTITSKNDWYFSIVVAK